MIFKRHSDATLLGMTKKELVEYVRVCEHNREVAEETLEQHIENVKDWQPVRHGKWIVLGQRTYGSGRCYTHYCSECGQHGFDDYKGCPGCFAKMDGGADNG